MKKHKKHSGQLPFYLMMLPGLLYLLINNYLPMIGIFIAFKDINFKKGLFDSKWVGFKNFKFLFKTTDAFIITRNTLLYNIAWLIIGTVLAIILAILINEIATAGVRKFVQTAILLPQCISIIIVAYMVNSILAFDFGYANQILSKLGREGIAWYSEPKYWPGILTITHLWKGIGYSVVLYLSSIVGIDKSYYECAELEGCGKLQQIWYITLPLIKPTIITLCLLSIGRIFYSDFGLFYQVPMNAGALFNATNTIDTYVQRALLERADVSMSSAASVYQSLVGFILVITSNLIVRKLDKQNALF